MSDPTYSISLTELERTALAKALGTLVTKLTNAPVQIENSATLPPPAPPREKATAPVPPVTTNLIAPRDRWARDRHGIEVPQPKGFEAFTVRGMKTEPADLEDKRARLKVSWQSQGSGYVVASCWDEKLFPWLAAQSKEPTATLYVVKSGKYLNVIGVRA